MIKQHFRLWGSDDLIYGPVDSATVQGWIAEERITPDSWLFEEERQTWHKAREIPAFKSQFAKGSAETAFVADKTKLKPSILRRIKVFATLTDEQLTRLVPFLEIQKVRAFAEVIRKGAPGDAMFFIMEGELRARIRKGETETILATLPQGEFFGEMALFDNGERSTDVIANSDCVLLRMSLYSFRQLLAQSADMAGPLLFAIGRTLVARIRRANKLLKSNVEFTRTVPEEAKPLISE